LPTPPTSPALRARYDRRQRDVVDAAARLFARRGYHATSIAAVRRATGLTAGGLYHYIAAKEDLLVLICEELMDPLLDDARTILATTHAPPRQLRDVLHAWLEHIERHLDHMRVFQQERHLIEAEPRWGTIRARRREFEELLDAILVRVQQGSAMRTTDRRLALLALLGMVNYTPQWFHHGGRLTAGQIADGYCDLVLGALAAHPPEGSDPR
jgi:TetR/AcrR family transcriptional regulator, cholesterol catabolism regulator